MAYQPTFVASNVFLICSIHCANLFHDIERYPRGGHPRGWPVRLVNVAYRAEDTETLKREINSLRYFSERLGGQPELVTVYPVKPQDSIETRLAHRYLMEMSVI